MATYLGNAFSLNMLDTNEEFFVIKVKKIDLEKAKEILKSPFINCVGHASTALILTKLGIPIDVNRIPVKLKRYDKAVIFQLNTRLEEGKILTEEELSQIPYSFYLIEVT